MRKTTLTLREMEGEGKVRGVMGNKRFLKIFKFQNVHLNTSFSSSCEANVYSRTERLLFANTV